MENNVIDFTVAKLEKLYKVYKRKNPGIASDLREIIIEYKKGETAVIWKSGLPYVKRK